MMRPLVILRWMRFLLICTAAACGPGVQEGPVPLERETVPTDSDDTGSDNDSDTSDTEIMPDTDTTDTNTEGTVAPDTDSVEVDAGIDTDPTEDWCPVEVIVDDAALSAEQILSGGELVAMDNGLESDCLLAVRPETGGFTAAVAFLSAQSENKLISISEAFVGAPPRAISCRHDGAAGLDIAYIVTSDATLSTLYELQGKDGAWQVVYEGARLTGVQQMFSTEPPRIDDLCVFGDGAVCFPRGQWSAPRVEIPVGEGMDIADMTLVSCEEGRCPAAVGKAGYVAIKQSGEWTRLPLSTASDLRDIAVYDSYISVVGEGGIFLYGDSTGLEKYEILDNRDIVSLVLQKFRNFEGVASDGTAFVGEVRKNDVYICPNWVAIEPPILDSGIFKCGEDVFLVLRPDALVGAYDCNIVTI